MTIIVRWNIQENGSLCSFGTPHSLDLVQYSGTYQLANPQLFGFHKGGFIWLSSGTFTRLLYWEEEKHPLKTLITFFISLDE